MAGKPKSCASEKDLRRRLLCLILPELRQADHGDKGRRLKEILGEYNDWRLTPDLRAELGPVTPRMFRRWRSRTRRSWERKPGGAPRGTRIPKDQQDYIIGLIAQTPHRRPARVHEYLSQKFPGAVPSRATVYRFVDSWQKDQKQVFAWMKNPDAWRGRFMPAFGNAAEKARYYLHAVEFDTSPADVRCEDGIRYKLLAGVDIFSRDAWMLVARHSTSIALASLWRKIILQAGHFDTAVMDNGAEYRSNHIMDAAVKLAIDVPMLPKFAPEKKPHVERIIGTVAHGLLEELPGFVGHNVRDAQALRNRKSFAERFMKAGEIVEIGMSAEQLQERIDTWLHAIYRQRRHSGIGMSPTQKAAKSQQRRWTINERALDVLLAPGGKAKVTKKGIQKGGLYQSTALAGAVGKWVDVKLDLANAGRIYVFALEEGTERWDIASGDWIVCKPGEFICVAHDASRHGLTAEEASHAKKAALKRVREKVAAARTLAQGLGDPMGKLLKEKAAKSNLIAFRRTVEMQTPEIEAAAEAAAADEGAERPANEFSENSCASEAAQATGEPDFEWPWQRYVWLSRESKTRALTEREHAWIDRYEQSAEFAAMYEDLQEVLCGTSS
jgi:putative transposase